MDRLREFLQIIWTKIVEILKNFENSSLFERIMRRYENLTPRGQRAFRGLLQFGAFLFVAFLILGGPFILLSKINRIKQLENLESNAMIFQGEYEAQTRGYTPPAGWKPLASSTSAELADSFNEYLPSIGVPEEFGTLVASGDSLNLTLREISVRQATNILFELEGLYPKVRTQSLRASPNAGQRDIMDMEASFQFNPAFANQVSSGVAPRGGQDMEEDQGVGKIAPPPSGKSGVGNRPSSPSNLPKSDNPNEVQNDFVPPPPPTGDYDELAPPDIPEDLPPPPPPGFEEEPQQ